MMCIGLTPDKAGEASMSCFVQQSRVTMHRNKATHYWADRQTDGQTDRQTHGQTPGFVITRDRLWRVH